MRKIFGSVFILAGLILMITSLFVGIQFSSIGSAEASHLSSINLVTDSVSGGSIVVHGTATLNSPPTKYSSISTDEIFGYGAGVIKVDNIPELYCGVETTRKEYSNVLLDDNNFWLLDKTSINNPEINCPFSKTFTEGNHTLTFEFKASRFFSPTGLNLIENDGLPNGRNWPRRAEKLLTCSNQEVACTGSMMYCDWFVSYDSSHESPCPDSLAYMSKDFIKKYWDEFNTPYTYASAPLKVEVKNSVINVTQNPSQVENPSPIIEEKKPDFVLMTILFLFGLILAGLGILLLIIKKRGRK